MCRILKFTLILTIKAIEFYFTSGLFQKQNSILKWRVNDEILYNDFFSCSHLPHRTDLNSPMIKTTIVTRLPTLIKTLNTTYTVISIKILNTPVDSKKKKREKKQQLYWASLSGHFTLYIFFLILTIN